MSDLISKANKSEPQSTNEYTAITDNVLVENTKIEFDLYLRTISGGPKYILFCRGNEKFSSERKKELLKKKEKRLYISTKDVNKYLEYQEKNLSNIIKDKNKSSIEKSTAVYQTAQVLTKDLMESPRSGVNISRASTWVSNTISHILNDVNTFSSLLRVTSHDYHTYTHSINMAVMGLIFGKHLSLKPHDLDCLGIGLLLHDIGKVAVSLNIINKPSYLTDGEFDVIKRHPKAGLDFLEHNEKVDGQSLKIVIQHHENHDGTGYPYGIAGNDIHLFGSIARIIDIYDAMTTKNPYSHEKSPYTALAEMKKKMPNCFHEELFKEFIYFLGPKRSRKKRVLITLNT
ncbi:MAG: hypothetical protein SCARUB_03385 [Candidatus Scalindua rubra]|uniref:HD-GYP domain-containing protein n=1 Tax=Candidatus Scalindua rubra TaxID=1872076 RepID=A0A1E3X7C5_9BACT|nr:MAG: hypothetical protein SCARUB_03385 [Candidatus Scalindua rubra]